MSDEDKRIYEYKENKKKWMIKHDFSKYVGKASLSKSGGYISNYVNITPSEPPLNYQFRIIRKEKWVSPTNFL